MVPVAAKAGALLAVAAAGSTSIWYFSDSIFGTSLVSIADEAPSSDYGDKSIGKNYSKYFLSSKTNKKIWEERYEKNKSKFAGENNANTKAKDKFGTVKDGYSNASDNVTALNKVCDSLYKLIATENVVNAEPTDNGTDKYTTQHIWKFCGLKDIVTVGEDLKGYTAESFPTTKIGGVESDKKLFVSTKDKDNVNDWFWNLKTKEFWSSTNNVSGSDKANHVFKKLKEEGTKDASVKATCELAYNKTTAEDSDNKNKEDALTFCSISLKLTSVPS